MLGETARSSTHQEHFRVFRQYSLDACFELEQCSGNDWWRFTSPRAHEHAQVRELRNGNLIQSFSSHWLFICRVQLACRVNTHNFSFIFIQNINIAYYLKTKEAGVLFYIICSYCSVVICLHEAVAQLTDELSWWRHRVRCCSNCRCVLPSSEVCTWSPDLPSTNFQVREYVVRVLGIEKLPQFP